MRSLSESVVVEVYVYDCPILPVVGPDSVGLLGGLFKEATVVKCHVGPSVDKPWLSHTTMFQKYVKSLERDPGLYVVTEMLLATLCNRSMLPKYTSYNTTSSASGSPPVQLRSVLISTSVA